MATQDIYNAVLEIDNTYSDRFSLQEFEENMQDEGFATAVQEVVGDTVKKKDESDGILEEEVTESTIEEEPLPTSSESLEESDSFEPYNPDQFGEFIQDEVVEETPSPSPEFDIDPKAQEYFAEVDKRNKQAWSGGGSPMTNEDKNELRVEMGVEEVVPVATDYIQVEEGGLTPLNEQVNDLIQQEANKKGRGFTESDENIQQIIKLGKALYDEEQKKWKEASERISKTENNESVAKEKKRQLEVSQSMDFKKSLDGLSDILSNPDMFYSKDSKKIWDRRKLIPELTKQYGKYDLIFSNGGMGDMINVSTSKGKDETINLINRDGSFELSPLKDFIAQNASIDSYFMDETIDATEQHYDEFMAERGFNGKGIRKAVNDLEFVRDKLALAEKLASSDWNFTDHNEAYVEKYPDLFVEASVGGKGKHMIPRSDLKSIIEKLEAEEDQLDDLVGENFSHNFNDDILKAQQDWDVVSADRRKELTKTFAKSNQEAQVTQKKVQYDSFMYFNKSMFKDGKLNISPEDIKTEEDEKKFLGFYDKYMDAAVSRKTASDAYRDANTYLSLQKNKNIKGAYLGEMDGLWANIDKNLALGRAQKAFGELSAYREDTDEDIKRGAAQEIVKQMGLSESFGESRALSEMHSVKGLMNNVAAWARNPAEISFGFFTGSMSMMLPYGKYLVLGGLATGAASGAAKGWFIGGPKGSLAGGLAGGIWGARAGMAAAAFGMEYTNALIAALTSKGYNIKDASSVEKALGDAEVWSEGMEIGIKRGIPISVMDFLSAGAAGKLFSAGKHMTASTRKRVAMLAAEQAVWGPVAEAVGEGAAMLAAGQELSAVDMFHEAIGAFGGNFSNIAYNVFQRTSQSAKIEYAENLRDINAVLSDNVNLKDLSSWINKMKLLGQIDAETAHTIEQNIGIKREVTSIMDTDFAHDFWDRALNPEVGAIKNRLGQLLNAKKQIDTPNERVYNSANISAINKEINEITSTGKMPKNPIQLTNTKVEYSVNGKKLNREQMATYLDTASPEQLLSDNIEINNPSPAMMEKLTNADKKVQDGIQKSSTESVDALQQAEDGSTVGVGDTKGSQVTEATQKENDKVGATKDKTTKEVLTEAGKGIVKAADRWAAGLKKEGEKKKTEVGEDHSPVGDIPIRNRGSATTDPAVVSGIEAKAADKNIERSIINGIKRGDSAQTIIDRVLSQYGFLSHQNEAIADYIRDRVSGKTTTKFDVWRKPKESVDTKAKASVAEEAEVKESILEDTKKKGKAKALRPVAELEADLVEMKERLERYKKEGKDQETIRELANQIADWENTIAKEKKKGKGRLQVENQSVKIRNLETDLGLRKDNILKRYLKSNTGFDKAMTKARAINRTLREQNSPYKAALTQIPGETGDTHRTYYAVNLEPREERGRLQVEGKKIPSNMGPTKKAPVKSGAIEGLKKLDKSAKTADQWIVGIAEKGGKGTMAELDAMGLDAFLKDYEKQNKGASIPRQVVADYMKANPVDISEITEEYNVAESKATLYPEVEKIFSEGYLPTLAKFFKEKFANKAKSIMDELGSRPTPATFIRELSAQSDSNIEKQIIKELKEMQKALYLTEDKEERRMHLPKRIREIVEKASNVFAETPNSLNFEGLYEAMIEHVEVGGEKQYERYVQPGKSSNYRNILLTDPASVAAKEDFSIVPYEEEEMQGAFEVRMSIVDTNHPTLDAETQKRHTDTVPIGGPFLSYEEAQEFIDSGKAQDRASKSTPQHISQGDPHFRGKGEMPKKIDFKQLSENDSAKIRKLINEERDIKTGSGQRLFAGQENAKTLRVFQTTTALPTSLFTHHLYPGALYIVEEKIGDEKSFYSIRKSDGKAVSFFHKRSQGGRKREEEHMIYTLDDAKAEANRQLKLEIENVTETAEQNLLSHTRVTERNIGGKKTLFVEEIQSQRAQNLTPNKAHKSDAVDAAFKPQLKRSERIKLEGLDKDITKEMESLETYQAIKENFGKVINAEAIQKQIDKLNFPKEITGKRIADYMFGRILNAVEDGVIDYDIYHKRTQMGSARKGYDDAIQSSISTVLKNMMETEFLSEIITESNSSLLSKERPKDINISEWKETTPDDIKVADAFFKWKSIPTSIIENLLQTYQNEQKDYSDVILKVFDKILAGDDKAGTTTILDSYMKKNGISTKAEVKKEIQEKWVRYFLKDFKDSTGHSEFIYLAELQNNLIHNNLMKDRAFPRERPKAEFHRRKNVKEALDSGFQDFRLAPIEKMLERDEIYRGLGRGTSPQMSHAKTEQWLGLNLRRLLKEAVDNGDEQIVFANGDQVQDVVQGAIEGQRKFYNEMLPRQLRDELKRLDKKAKIKRIAVPEEIDEGREFGESYEANLGPQLIQAGVKAGILEKDAQVTAENLDKTVNSIKIDEYLDPLVAKEREAIDLLKSEDETVFWDNGPKKEGRYGFSYLKNITDELSRTGKGFGASGETIQSIMEAYSYHQRGQTMVAVEITPGLKEALKESITKFQINKKKGKERRSDIKIITDKIKAAFPSVEVATDGASFDKIMAEEGIRERKFSGEKVLGITKGGKIWINPDTKTITTPIHEFGHIWVDYLRDESSGIKGTKLLEKGLSLVDPKSAEYKHALEIYGEYEDGKLINEELVREETLVEMIATKGETIANESKRKDFKSWINDMFEFIKKHLTTTAKFLKDKVWAAKIEALTIEEFTDMALADLFSGGVDIDNPTAKARMQVEQNLDLFGEAVPEGKGRPKRKSGEPAPPKPSERQIAIGEFIEKKRDEQYTDTEIKKQLRSQFPGITAEEVDQALDVDTSVFYTAKMDQLFEQIYDKMPEILKNIRFSHKVFKDKKGVKNMGHGGVRLGEEVLDTLQKHLNEYTSEKQRTLIQVRTEIGRLMRGARAYQALSETEKKEVLFSIDELFGIAEGEVLNARMKILKQQITQRKLGKGELKKEQRAVAAALKDLFPEEVAMPSQWKKVINKLTSLSPEVIKTTMEDLVKVVEKEIEKAKLEKIQDIKGVVKKAGSLRRNLKTNKIQTSGKVSADTQTFFAQAKRVLKAVLIKDPKERQKALDTIAADILSPTQIIETEEYVDPYGERKIKQVEKTIYLDNQPIPELADALEAESQGYPLTMPQKKLLFLKGAYDMLKNLKDLDIKELIELYDTLLDRQKTSRQDLIKNLNERSKKNFDLKLKARREVQKIFGNLVMSEISAPYQPIPRIEQDRYIKLIEDSFDDFNPKQAYRTKLTLTKDKNGTDVMIETQEKIENVEEIELELNGENLKIYRETRTDEDGNALKPKYSVLMRQPTVALVNERRERYPELKKMLDKEKFTSTAKKLWEKFKQNPSAMLNPLGFFGNLEGMTLLLDRPAKSDSQFFYREIKERVDKMTSDANRGFVDVMAHLDEFARTSFEKYKTKVVSLKDILTLPEVWDYFDVPMAKGTQLFSGNELMRIYALSKNDEQLYKMLHTREGEYRITQETLDFINENLPPELREFVDKIVEFLSGPYYESINEIFKKINNVNLTHIANYFSTKTDSQAAKSAFKALGEGDFSSIFNAQNQTAVKARMDKTGQVILKDEGFFSTLEDHIREMERFKAMADPVQDLNALMSEAAVRMAMLETGMLDYINFSLNATINPKSMDLGDRTWIDASLRIFINYVMGMKAVQLFKQATSSVFAFKTFRVFKDSESPLLRFIDKTPVGTAVDLSVFALRLLGILARWQKSIKRAKLISANFKLRWENADLYDLEAPAGTIKKILRPPKSMWHNPIGALMDWRENALMIQNILTKIGDAAGVLGYLALYDQLKANGKSDAEALKAFEKYDTSQQTRRTQDLTKLQLQRNIISRTSVAFGSMGFLQLNNAIPSLRNIISSMRRGKIPTSEDTRSLVLNMFIGNFLFQLAANTYLVATGDEDDDEKTAFSRIFWGTTFGTLTMGIPLLGAALETLLRATVEGVAPKKAAKEQINPFMEFGKRIFRATNKDVWAQDKAEIASLLIAGMTGGIQTDPLFGAVAWAKELGYGPEEEGIPRLTDNFGRMLGITYSSRPTMIEGKKKLTPTASRYIMGDNIADLVTSKNMMIEYELEYMDSLKGISETKYENQQKLRRKLEQKAAQKETGYQRPFQRMMHKLNRLPMRFKRWLNKE